MSACSMPGCVLPGVHQHLFSDDATGTLAHLHPVSEDQRSIIRQQAVNEFCADIGVDPSTDKVADVRKWVEDGKAHAREQSAAAARDARIGAAGWGHPVAARAWHYFEAGSIKSLCGRWAYAGSRDSGSGSSADDCKVCLRKLAAR